MERLQRAALLSMHTSPLDQPGAGDAGGMNVYVRSLALELAQLGVGVDIYTRSDRPRLKCRQEVRPGVSVHYVEAGPQAAVPKEELERYVAPMAQAVLARHEHRPYDVLHSHYWLSGLVGLRLSAAWDVPLVHTMHTMALVKNRQYAAGRPEPLERIEGERRIAREAARLTANTTVEQTELVDLYDVPSHRIDVVPPGVDLSIFRPSAPPDGAWPQPRQGALRVLFAGRIQRLKGPNVLIEAVAELRRVRPDIALDVRIVGSRSGSSELDLPDLVGAYGLADTVRLHEPVPAAELAGWFTAADVVVVPSHSESFGLVALEAQACGTPVLATNVGGLRANVRDGVTGALVEGLSAAAWAAAIAGVHDNRELWRRYGRQAAESSLGFGWEQTARRTLQSYERARRDAHRPSSGAAAGMPATVLDPLVPVPPPPASQQPPQGAVPQGVPRRGARYRPSYLGTAASSSSSTARTPR